MILQVMGGKWTTSTHKFLCFTVFILVLEIQGCCSLNSEGLALLEFRNSVYYDPYGALVNWNANDTDPCAWSGVHCEGTKVQILDLNGQYLEGTLAPELMKLADLRFLILSKNRFYGAIPKEIGKLRTLEILDLRDNNLSGTIPAEIGDMLSLKRLLICDNKFEGSVPIELRKLNLLVELQFDENLTYDAVESSGFDCVNRKFGDCIWQSSSRHLNIGGLVIPFKAALKHYFTGFLTSKFGKYSLHGHEENFRGYIASSSDAYIVQNVPNQANFARRKLLEQTSNLPASPAPNKPFSSQNSTAPASIRSSGSFPAIPNSPKKQHAPSLSPVDPPLHQSPNRESGQPVPTENTSKNIWKYFLISCGAVLLLIIIAAMIFLCKTRGVTTIGPWKTGLSGQLQKAFVTGVPKLNRSELETACEDFSNILDTFDGCTVYKGTLSSGVEIGVASTTIVSAKDWSKSSETIFRKKIDMMSRVNHKNFINLLGYCEEDEPFIRMMVFEYAPNGSLFEYLHVEEVGHLDWNTRMRIIMGTAYCLQHMHHDLNPPVSHANLVSTSIFLTDDYAAKIADIGFWKDITLKSESSHFEMSSFADLEKNVYSFGILLLEIISGKILYSEEQGLLANWVSELNDIRNINDIVDPTLKSFKSNELDVIFDVIQDCIQPDSTQRPTMKEVTSKLRQVIGITPEAATPRLSPLWWAELEILSAETT